MKLWWLMRWGLWSSFFFFFKFWCKTDNQKTLALSLHPSCPLRVFITYIRMPSTLFVWEMGKGRRQNGISRNPTSQTTELEIIKIHQIGVWQNFIMTSIATNNMCFVANSLSFQGRGQYFCRSYGRGNASGFAHSEFPASSTVPVEE